MINNKIIFGAIFLSFTGLLCGCKTVDIDYGAYSSGSYPVEDTQTSSSGKAKGAKASGKSSKTAKSTSTNVGGDMETDYYVTVGKTIEF